MTTPAESARFWIDRGYWPVPVPFRTKRPILDGWPRLRVTKENVDQYFNGAQQNIGVILGDRYNSADVDLDSPEATLAADEFLPDTGIIFGRKSKPRSHWLYRSDPAVKTRTFEDPVLAKEDKQQDTDRAMLVELRGRKKDGGIGLQTIVPLSVHPEGELICFAPGFDREPANVEAKVLVKAVSHLAATALLARYWPKEGARHQAFLALAGILARERWDAKEILRIHRGIYRVLWPGNPDFAACASEVGTTVAKAADDAPTTAYKTLSGLMPSKALKKALEWLKALQMPSHDKPPTEQERRTASATSRQPKPAPIVMTANELMDAKIEPPSMLVEGMLARHGVNLICGAQRSGKTLLMAQVGISVVAGGHLFDWFKVVGHGPVMFIQQDDRNGGASLQQILLRSPISVRDKPFYPVFKTPWPLGLEFYTWLESEIKSKGLILILLDSYTTLRPPHRAGGDLVKVELDELTALGDLAIRNRCCFGLIHHESQGSKRNAMHWSNRAGGTYAMTAATEMMVHVCRFHDLDSNAAERLVRTRGRHANDVEFVMRFREPTLDHEFIMDGPAAEHFPLIQKLKQEFGSETFTPRKVCMATGVGRTTAHRQIDTLHRGGVLTRVAFGEYALKR